jgi:hypothetical protein
VEKYSATSQATDGNSIQVMHIACCANGNSIQSMRIACFVTMATDTQSEYVIFIAFSRQKWLRERASMLRLCVHCLSCVTTTTKPKTSQ